MYGKVSDSYLVCGKPDPMPVLLQPHCDPYKGLDVPSRSHNLQSRSYGADTERCH